MKTKIESAFFVGSQIGKGYTVYTDSEARKRSRKAYRERSKEKAAQLEDLGWSVRGHRLSGTWSHPDREGTFSLAAAVRTERHLPHFPLRAAILPAP